MVAFRQIVRDSLAAPALFGLGALATLVAAAIGTFLGLVITLPLSLLFIILFPLLLGPFLLAAILAAPITLLLLPLTALALRGHWILAQFAIPVVGLISGYAIIPGWIALGVLPINSHELFSAVGMISGLSAGGFFVRGLYA